MRSRGDCGFVEVLLKTREHPADLFGLAEIGNGVGNGVVVFELSNGDSFSLSSSWTPTLTYCDRTKSRNACCLLLNLC